MDCGNKPGGGGRCGANSGDNGFLPLRAWLDKPRRVVKELECLHVFRQVAYTHACTGIGTRPSLFLLSSLGHGLVSVVAQQEEDGKEVDGLELRWYSIPDEANGDPSSHIYQLGLLLFELFCVFDYKEEKAKMMAELRHRILPSTMLLKWPKVASFCMWLLHPRPASRPTIEEVLQSEFLNDALGNLKEREVSIRLKEDIEDQEILMEFLQKLLQRKQETADTLHDIISVLSSDIQEVERHQPIVRKDSHVELEKDDQLAKGITNYSSIYPSSVDGESVCSGSRKRLRLGRICNEDNFDAALDEGRSSRNLLESRENFLSRSSRLMKNFNKLEAAYLSTRGNLIKPDNEVVDCRNVARSIGHGSTLGTEVSTVDNSGGAKSSHIAGRSEWINPFLDSLCKYMSFSELKVREDFKQGHLLSSPSLICCLDFDRDKEFLATAGINRKIKIFEFSMILDEDRDIHYPVVELSSKSKLSSICWNNYIKSQIASSDFEGVVQVWDVARSQVFVAMKEHQRRVWSVDFSHADPTKLASGSDDGTVKLWNINQETSIGTIKTKANVCSVCFAPNSARSLAIGSADHKVYCYDLRNLGMPCFTFVGHTKAVSYIRFLDSSTLVSGSTDNSLKLWDLSTGRTLCNPIQTYSGHTNVKNFVGLSIFNDYIATGSETNEVYVYHKAFPMPMLSYKFTNADPILGRTVDDPSQFISSVCWRGESPCLVASSSNGNIKVLDMI